MKLITLGAVVATAVGAQAATCSISAIKAALPANVTVDFATHLEKGATFTVPATDLPFPTSPTDLRAVCAVQVTVPSSASSNYSFGMFLPDDWNGRFLAVGNSGYAGGINWLSMGGGLGYGFAVMSTNTGHSSEAFDGSWAYKNKEAIVDFGYRAMHGSVVLAKELTTAFYNTKPAFNYYNGCSTGGRQGLKEMQMYPEDFDGIVAGAPAWAMTRQSPALVKLGSYNLPYGSAHHINSSMFEWLAKEVIKQCDAADGVVDSIISDPGRCEFRPDLLLCTPTNSNTSACLTKAQIGTLSMIYNDYVDTNQTFVFPHYLLGSEEQWDVIIDDGTGSPNPLGLSWVQDFLQRGPTWKWEDFDYSVVEQSEAVNPGNTTADDYDLRPFMKRAGKVITYHGMADSIIATGSSALYHKNVYEELAPLGIDIDNFYRHFEVPGMQHCMGTPASMNAPWYFGGSDQPGYLTTDSSKTPGFKDQKHDVLVAMMAWVENGTAPDSIIATKWRNDTLQDSVLRQRPLCVYPKKATYSGSGNVNTASNWSCK